ncbi:MAG TPA: universal stress protein [Polyangiales bacterium]|nr:universal stress protein [Polyangiales bacterium]
MAIVCGTDLSAAAIDAASAAACLAVRKGVPLYLVHALDPALAAQRDLAERADRQLHEQAEQLRKLGPEVHVTIRAGSPDAVLIQSAHDFRAALVVVGAEGQQLASGRRIGVHSERVAQRCGVPVLVVRDAAPFMAWSPAHERERPLKIVLGAEPSFSTECAARQLIDLCALGPCAVTAARLFWPPTEFQRLGFSGARSYVDIDPRVTQVLAAEVRHLLPPSEYKLRVEPHLGNLGERLAAIAVDEKADLIVVGSHDRNMVERIWEGSTSHATLHNSHTSVLCVPTEESGALRKRRTACVVVATDFSRLGDAALPLAYAIAEPGAIIHVLHVVPAREQGARDFHDIFALDDLNVASPARDEAWQHMRQLTSRTSEGPDKRVVLHALESDNAAEAIAQAAERLHADVIVMGTRGRSGLSKAVMGSVTSNVVHLSKRPVLLVRE